MLAVLRTLNFLPPTRSYQALMLQNAQVAPAASTGQHAGDRLAEVGIEGSSLRPRQIVQTAAIAGCDVDHRPPFAVAVAQTGDARHIVEPFGEIAHQAFAFAETDTVEGREIRQHALAVE